MRRSLLMAILCLLAMPGARADRVILSPLGDTLAPRDFKMELAVSSLKGTQNLSWTQFATAQGLEFEALRFDSPCGQHGRYALNLQYPLLSELGGVPAIALGVRDLFDTGLEKHAFYIATTKSIGLSERQARLVRELKLNAGLGTSRLDGLFLGMETHLRSGIRLQAELYRRRFNFGVAVPLARGVQGRTYSLGGSLFYGLSYHYEH